LCVTVGRGRIQVLLDNVAAGHSFPSGATQDRRLWAELTAFSGGVQVFQSGAIDAGQSDSTNTDADLWQMRDCIFDDAGTEVHNFWDAASFESNALPAQVTFDMSDSRFYQSHVVRRFPLTADLPADPDRVVLQMKLRPVSLDVLNDLVGSGDLDAAVRDRLVTFDVGKKLEWTPATGRVVKVEMGFPVSCVSATNLTLEFPATAAVRRARCTP
jgi:hypothetical protein